MDVSVEIARRSALLRRRLAVVAIVVAAFSTGTYVLATSGTNDLTINSPAGLPASGHVADVTAMTGTVTRTNGAATLTTGVTIAKVNVEAGHANGIRLEISWTNVSQAVSVLNNPNAQISIGVYHTIHTGNCNTAGTGSTVDAPLINLTDTNSATYCAALDQSATGSPSVSTTGKLLLTTSIVAGSLNPALDGSGTVSACAANTANDNDVWCQPSSVTNANQRVLFLIASVTVPGSIPSGQQASVSTLGFFVNARSLKT